MGGGTTKTENEPPEWFSDAAVKALEVADQINQAGYVPYQGNEIAAFNPQQSMAFQSAADWMGAANGQRPIDTSKNLPMPTMGVDGSGVAGYGSYNGLLANLKAMKERSPSQYAQLTKFGGDLLADPSKIPGEVTDSPWAVGKAAQSSMMGEMGGYGRFLPPPSREKAWLSGFEPGNPRSPWDNELAPVYWRPPPGPGQPGYPGTGYGAPKKGPR